MRWACRECSRSGAGAWAACPLGSQQQADEGQVLENGGSSIVLGGESTKAHTVMDYFVGRPCRLELRIRRWLVYGNLESYLSALALGADDNRRGMTKGAFVSQEQTERYSNILEPSQQ